MPIAISWNAHLSRSMEVRGGAASAARRSASSGVLPVARARCRALSWREARFLALSASTVP